MYSKVQWSLHILLMLVCCIVAYQWRVDFDCYYGFATWFHEGDWQRIYTNPDPMGRFYYPPFTIFLFEPLAMLPFAWARVLWTLLEISCYAVIMIGIPQLFPILKEKAGLVPWLLFWIFALNPVHVSFQTHNVSYFIFAAFLICEILARSNSSRSQFAAGLFAGFLSLVKFQPAFVVILYLFRYRRPTQLGVVLGGLFAIVLPFLMVGIEQGAQLYQLYFNSLGDYSTAHVNDPLQSAQLSSLHTAVYRIAVQVGLGLVVAKSVANLFVVLCVLAFLAFLVRHSMRTHSELRLPSLELWAIACALSALLHPGARSVHYFFYIPAFCALITHAFGESTRRQLARWSMGIVLLLLTFTTHAVIGSHLSRMLMMQNVAAWGACVLVGYLLISLRMNPHEA